MLDVHIASHIRDADALQGSPFVGDTTAPPHRSTGIGSDTHTILHATPDCPNPSALLPSFGQARVTCWPRHAGVAGYQRKIWSDQMMPMASTLSATRDALRLDDPLLDGGVAPTMAKDRYTSVEEALTRLAHQTASHTPDARASAPAPVGSADASQSIAAATLGPTLGPADLSAQIPREERSPGKQRALARVAIVVCLGAAVIWAWQSYGGRARDMVATLAAPVSARPAAEQTPAAQTPEAAQQKAARPVIETTPSQAASTAQPAATVANAPSTPSAKPQQVETMARDLAALRQTVDRLAAGQEQLIHEMAKLQAPKPQADKPAEKHTPRRSSAPARGPDVFDPAQSPNAPGVPRTLGSIVVPR
jgi:hypothetical protein